jgi:hypothetical protein
MKLLTTTALFTAMAVAPALAQTAQPGQAQDRAQPQAQTQQTQPGQPAELNFMQQQQSGQWSAEWLTNSNVYSPQDENIGTINDIILSSDGSVEAVVIGVGGFLGIGEKDVAVNFDALEMRPAPAAGTTAGTGTGQPPQRTDQPAQQQPPAGQPATGQQVTAPPADRQQQQAVTGMGADNLRIYVNASREQLEAAPEFNRLSSQEGGIFGGGSAQ